MKHLDEHTIKVLQTILNEALNRTEASCSGIHPDLRVNVYATMFRAQLDTLLAQAFPRSTVVKSTYNVLNALISDNMAIQSRPLDDACNRVSKQVEEFCGQRWLFDELDDSRAFIDTRKGILAFDLDHEHLIGAKIMSLNGDFTSIEIPLETVNAKPASSVTKDNVFMENDSIAEEEEERGQL